MNQQKESYTEPVLVAHELLRDITGVASAVKEIDKFTDKMNFE